MNEVHTQLKLQSVNWLPLPEKFAVFETELPHDHFLKGEVIEYFPRQGIGRVKAFSGLEYAFALPELELIGAKAHASYLKLGSKVGFDVSQSSQHLRIKRLKIYS